MNANEYLPPRLLQWVGVALLVSSAVFWMYTGRESVLMMTSAMSLIGLGSYRGAVESLKRNGDKR